MAAAPVCHFRRLIHQLLMLIVSIWASAGQAADPAPEAQELPRHALETRALVDPDGVLKAIPQAIEVANLSRDQRELALVFLAQANACRVIADWFCQRTAGAAARTAAAAIHDPILQIRGLIAESRATIALQDFTRGQRLLGDAEVLLRDSPSPELSADVFLAYSSLSFSIGKNALSAEYAQRGLAGLDADTALPMQARLLRNLARAQAQLGDLPQARQSLQRSQALVERFVDPKLGAELALEAARLAHQLKDVTSQRSNGERVLQMAGQLKNSQLVGMGHEVLGLAALDAADLSLAATQLRTAWRSFQSLGMARDELRLLRALIPVLLDLKAPLTELDPLFRRSLELDQSIVQSERAQAADDFDVRLKYAEQEMDVMRLENEASVARERESALVSTTRLIHLLVLLALLVVLVLAIYFLQLRRSNRRLREAADQIQRHGRENERLLLNILPPVIAKRLRDGEQSIADAFAGVSVMFADIVGFTALSSRVGASELVGLLNALFCELDDLALRFGVEKIKTIGDAYMAVCGLPVPRADHADLMVAMAEQMLLQVQTFNRRHGTSLSLRIGISSGPVIAGIIGSHKFAYDLWGETVNLAARMESHGLPGRVQLSQQTRNALKRKFVLEPRGEIEIKGIGRLHTWLLGV